MPGLVRARACSRAPPPQEGRRSRLRSSGLRCPDSPALHTKENVWLHLSVAGKTVQEPNLLMSTLSVDHFYFRNLLSFLFLKEIKSLVGEGQIQKKKKKADIPVGSYGRGPRRQTLGF